MWVGSAFGKFSEGRFRERIRLVSLLFAALYSLLLLRLFFLQVLKGENFSQMSELNRTQILFLRAPRGNFYDRNNDLLVTNRPSWSLVYSVPANVAIKREEVEAKLVPFLQGYDDRWKKRLLRAFQTKKLVRLVENVPSAAAFGMREMGALLPGARMEMEFTRNYEQGSTIGHLIGYLGEIDEKELQDDFWSARKTGDIIGKMGLEKVLDERIRGKDGGTVVEVDSLGRLKRVIRELPYQAGNSSILTINEKAQTAALEGLLASPTKRGAAVALNVHTGEVLTWLSCPAFDPSKSFSEQSADRASPFFDRVYKGTYPPGSLFKLITAMAALEKRMINFSEEITCVGYVTLPDKQMQQRRYGCWHVHGRINFWRAVAESCDSYFYILAQKLGPQAMYEMARQFGLGEPAQSIFSGESVGNVPNPVWKRKKGYGGWSTGDSLNMAIGQGFITASTLQMAEMMAIMGSRGQVYQPYVVSKIIDTNGKTVQSFGKKISRTVTLTNTTWDTIFKAMRAVVKQGTGRSADIPYLDVYGKTGTAQNPHGEDHAWFGAIAGYAGEKPEVAVCVFVENGGHGSGVAAPIARKIIEKLLPPRPESEATPSPKSENIS